MNHTPPSSRPRQSLIINQNATQNATQRGGDKAQGRQPPSPRHQNAFADLLIEGLSLHVQSFHVRQFLDAILSEADVRQVLATPVRADGKTVRLLVQVVQPVAEDAQRRAPGSPDERDAVYAATILLGVDYCFLPALCGKYDAPDALKSVVWPTLQQLDSQAPQGACALRTCMRWGNFDEEDYFIDWLEARMQRALDVLKLAAF
jgi:hypothetical protein